MFLKLFYVSFHNLLACLITEVGPSVIKRSKYKKLIRLFRYQQLSPNFSNNNLWWLFCCLMNAVPGKLLSVTTTQKSFTPFDNLDCLKNQTICISYILKNFSIYDLDRNYFCFSFARLIACIVFEFSCITSRYTLFVYLWTKVSNFKWRNTS